jgi:hypothetical protein
MLTARFKKYLDKKFFGVPLSREAADLKAEFMDALTSRAADLKAEGKDDDTIFRLAIESLGDVSGTLKTLLGNPITLVRDSKFWLDFVYAAIFALVSVIVYLAAAYFTNKWGLLAVIIFPAMAGAIFIAFSILIIKRNQSLKVHRFSGFLVSSYFVLIVVAVYFALTFSPFGIRRGLVKDTWSLFTLIPALVLLASALTTKFLRKKPVPAGIWFAFIPSFSVAVYLIAAAFANMFGSLWIIILLGVVGDLALVAYRINKRIKNR